MKPICIWELSFYHSKKKEKCIASKPETRTIKLVGYWWSFGRNVTDFNWITKCYLSEFSYWPFGQVLYTPGEWNKWFWSMLQCNICIHLGVVEYFYGCNFRNVDWLSRLTYTRRPVSRCSLPRNLLLFWFEYGRDNWRNVNDCTNVLLSMYYSSVMNRINLKTDPVYKKCNASIGFEFFNACF